MNELTTETGFVTGEPRPVWDYTDDFEATTLHLEPSRKEELGLVFLQLKRGEWVLGIWLDSEHVDSLRYALDRIADYAETHGEDVEP